MWSKPRSMAARSCSSERTSAEACSALLRKSRRASDIDFTIGSICITSILYEIERRLLWYSTIACERFQEQSLGRPRLLYGVISDKLNVFLSMPENISFHSTDGPVGWNSKWSAEMKRDPVTFAISRKGLVNKTGPLLFWFTASIFHKWLEINGWRRNWRNGQINANGFCRRYFGRGWVGMNRKFATC